MELQNKYISLKNGKLLHIRSPKPEDAGATLTHIKITSSETDFMARYPEEISTTIEKQEKILENSLLDNKSLFVCGEVDNKIVAIGSINCVKRHIKYLHRASFGISILKEYWNLGIGSQILQELITNAKEMGFEQLELEVVANNLRAIALYKKLGFKEYGICKHSFKYKDGTYADQILMFLPL